MARGFPLQDEGPGMKELFHDLQVEQEEAKARKGCATCAELARGSFGPRHDPSPRCESGKRPHCTCDICF